ncbi:sulfotransferase family protein [Ectobacillus panaciterrae]|uniref:sulfotransferase family protein n=1 Tax=Ectobacillus panaciterrae TaxID=363872 RepID=UPI0003FC396F|nr:sulfotransferase family protein [Ectobacillus panaciterrae]
MENRKFLVLGHPRSGTGFMVKLFRQFGYQIGHEIMGRDGISSWMLVVDDYQVYTDLTLNRKDFTFDYIIMNLRHPLDIISSSYFTENPSRVSLDYRKKHLNLEGLNRVEVAVKSVLDWYKKIELQRPNLKVCIDKNPEEKLFYFLKRFENKESLLPVEKIERKVNARNHPDLTFSFIKANCNKDIVLELENFCNLYEYKIA